MKSIFSLTRIFSLGTLMLFLAGCGTTDDGGGAGAGAYYGVGFYDPWYYGGYNDDVDVIVTPPDRPAAPARPSHPIARPPASAARPTPMPSIPSVPRVSPRR